MNNLNNTRNGVCHYGESKSFIFTPNTLKMDSIKPFHAQGNVSMLSDGTVEFIPKNHKRKRPQLIKKLPHGRLSHTNDGAVLLTIKIYEEEGNLCTTLDSECESAVLALALL